MTHAATIDGEPDEGNRRRVKRPPLIPLLSPPPQFRREALWGEHAPRAPVPPKAAAKPAPKPAPRPPKPAAPQLSGVLARAFLKTHPPTGISPLTSFHPLLYETSVKGQPAVGRRRAPGVSQEALGLITGFPDNANTADVTQFVRDLQVRFLDGARDRWGGGWGCVRCHGPVGVVAAVSAPTTGALRSTVVFSAAFQPNVFFIIIHFIYF